MTPEIEAVSQALQSKEFSAWLQIAVASLGGKMADHQRLAPGFADDMAVEVVRVIEQNGFRLIKADPE